MSKKPAKQQGPVLSLTKANDMNMMVLKRIDRQIEEILANAGHVCLYRMSVDDQQWQRKNIEGSLFLIKRRTQPRFQMLVLNKLSTDNYIETVHGGLEMETNPPYLMYTHGNDEIHGIWFYDENDLQRLSSLLQKILNQLPKPDGSSPAAALAQQGHYQPAPAAAAAPEPVLLPEHQHVLPAPQPLAQQPPPAGATGDGDAFWDKRVHVTEDSLPSSQQLVPNSSLLAEQAPAASSSGVSLGGLQGLLKAAQQKHSSAQHTQQRLPPSPLQPSASVPVPNSTSMPAEPAPAAAGLLTPAFFLEQQKAKQAAPGAGVAAAAPAVLESAVSDSAAVLGQSPGTSSVVSPAAAAPNGTEPGNALHKLLSRAAKHTPGGPAPAQAGASGSSAGTAAPCSSQPPLGVLSPEVVRERLKAAVIRLANNDAFVDMLAQEMKTVGLLQ